MIQAIDLEKRYGPQVIFDKASFSLGAGERVGLVGRNGHGKTTLFKFLIDEEHPDAGRIVVPNNYTIGHLSQHLKFTHPTTVEEACSALPIQDGGWVESYKAEAVLMGLGFTEEDAQQDPMKLSGGLQVRLNLAKVLLTEPNLLLLDEPTNYLDIVSIRWLTRFLSEWPREFMIITHDREFMDSVTTHTMGIHRQKIRKMSGGTDKFYSQLEEEEQIYEQTRQNQEKKRRDIEKFVNRFRAKASKAKSVQSRVKALEKMGQMEELGDIAELDFKFRAEQFSGKWPIAVEDVSFGYSKSTPPLITGLNLMVGKTDRIAIIGKNGRGKTTLMNLLAGEFEPTAGRVMRHSNLLLGYFGQTNINRLSLQNTVEQEIINAHPEHNRGKARSICGLMMFEGDLALKKIQFLSGGERSRVLLGKLLVSPTNCLMLDEPTNHLDMYSIESLMEAIEEFPGPVITVTHSEELLRRIATRLVVFDRGSVEVFEGTYDEFLDRVGWEDEGELKKSKKSVAKGQSSAAIEKALKPIRRRVERCEEKIISLELSVKDMNQQIAAAVERNDNQLVTNLSWDVHALNEEIKTLFNTLEELAEEERVLKGE